MATANPQTAGESEYTTAGYVDGYDNDDDLYWLESQLSLLHDHRSHPAGIKLDGHMNPWLGGQMIDPNEVQDHITELPAERKMRDVAGSVEMEVLRFKTDRPEIKEAARLLDEQPQYSVETETEGAIISVKRVVTDIH